MDTFLNLHQKSVSGVIATFDRLIFKAHLNSFFPDGAFKHYLDKRGVLLRDARKFLLAETERIKTHAVASAQDIGRPYVYLGSSHTHASGRSKEAMARDIAAKDGITDGLVCVFSVLETCHSIGVQGNQASKRLEVVRKRRKCLHFYWYIIDPVFGWMHVRIQSWAPYSMQVYVNGREWMARQLDRINVPYTKSDNKIISVSNYTVTDRLSSEFTQIPWPAFLGPLAEQANPLLPDITEAGFSGYWWVIDQAEYATDILFKNRQELEHIRADLMAVAMTGFDATDVMRFLDRKPHHAFTGEVTIDHKKRPEGCRIKFRLKANSIKIYDHLNVLRIETTINNPREFKVLVSKEKDGKSVLVWSPMGKSVVNFRRYSQVAQAANQRLIDALATAQLSGDATEELDSLCQSKVVNGQRVSRFNPVEPATVHLFQSVMAGDFSLNGFRNKDLQAKLFDSPPVDKKEAERRTHSTSRLIAKLRRHGLISKVTKARLYRVTKKGIKAMWPAVRFRHIDFPTVFNAQTREAA